MEKPLLVYGDVVVPANGSCLCKAVTYEVEGPLRSVINCHCNQCRKWTGHFVAATAAWKRDLRIYDPHNQLTWFQSTEQARRGFCRRCGSSLFWQSNNLETTTILAGTLDGATGLKTEAQIYVEEKGDYYTLGEPEASILPKSGHNVRLEAKAD